MTFRLVVTGAGGFLGGRVVALALARGHDVTALVRDHEHSLPKSSRLDVRTWNADDPGDAGAWMRGANAIAHLAAFYPTQMSDPRHAASCLRTNSLGTLDVLQAAHEEHCHFVYLSGGQLYRAQGTPAAEESPIWPARHGVYYLASKLVGELYVDHFSETHGASTTIIRAGSLYGPGLNRGVVNHFLRCARDRASFDAATDYAVDLTFVDDVAWAVLECAEHNHRGIYNIGSGVATTMASLGQMVLGLLGAPASLLNARPFGQPGFDPLDVHRAREILGFRPTRLDEGLRLTAEDLPA